MSSINNGRLAYHATIAADQSRSQLCRGRVTRENRIRKNVDGAPLASGRREAPAGHTAEQGTAGVYRPRYEVVAGQILDLISELAICFNDPLPTEKDLAVRLGTS